METSTPKPPETIGSAFSIEASLNDKTYPSPSELTGSNNKMQTKTYPKRERKPKLFDNFETENADALNHDKNNHEGDIKHSGRRGRPPKVVTDVEIEEEEEIPAYGADGHLNEKKTGRRGRPSKVVIDGEVDVEKEEGPADSADNQPSGKKTGRRGRPPKQIRPINETSIDDEAQLGDSNQQVDGKEKRKRCKPKKYIDDEYDLDISVDVEEKLNAPGHQVDDKEKKKRGRPRKKNDENESFAEISEIVEENSELFPSSEKRKRGRPKRSVTNDLDISVDIGEKLDASQNKSGCKEKCKRGRKRKFADTESNSNSTKAVEQEDNFEILQPSSKRRRGKPKTYAEDDDLDDFIDDEKKVNASKHKIDGQDKRKRGRSQKYSDSEMDLDMKIESIEDESCDKKDVSDNDGDSSGGTSGRKSRKVGKGADTECDSTEGAANSVVDAGKKTSAVGSRGRPGRKRKVVNISEEDDDDLTVEEEPESIEPKQKRRKYKKKEIDADNADQATPVKPAVGRVHQCPKCDHTEKGTYAMQRHVALEHQLWWSLDEPQGTDRYSGLTKVLKIKKFLNCPKCTKRINFVQYYQKHLEWCGREGETFSCEKCGRNNLMLQWKHMHVKSCHVILAEQAEKHKAELAAKRANGENDGLDEEEEEGGRVKRKAAKRARTMVQNLSKNVEVLGHSDDSDSDAAIELEKDGQVKEETDDDIDAELDDDEEDLSDAVEDLDEGQHHVKLIPKQRIPGKGHYGRERVSYFKRYHYVYEHMLRWMEKHWSEVLFPDWLPRKQDWHIQSPSESEAYLPKQTAESLPFTFWKNRKCDTLTLYQSSIVKGRPLFYTGLSVWRLAWCPMPPRCSADQYLAVVGKVDHRSPFLCNQANAGPGLIQVWNTRITDNSCSVKDDHLPKLCYTVVHDYGMASEIIWCPTGCYQTKKDKQADPESWRRLGVLAVAFTDGTVRIFSLPELAAPSDGDSPPTYRASPVVSLVPYRGKKEVNIACTCIDWIKSNAHSKIIAGYSDGSIRVYHLTTQSPWLRDNSTEGNILFPFQSFRPYGTVIHSVRWCFTQENLIAMVTDDFDTLFLDLRSPMSFKFQDSGLFMGTNMASSLWNPGVYISADDNYAPGTNRLRYLECASVLYPKDSMVRKDEVNNMNLATQSACAWEVSCSDWLSYVISCDNKGNLNGMPMLYSPKFCPDCKIYQYRQALMKTTICLRKDSDTKTESPNEDVGDTEVSQTICTCSQEEGKDIQNCAKCRINQSESPTQTNSCENNQSDHLILENSSSNNGPDVRPVSSGSQTSSQSEDVLQNSADKGDNNIKVGTSDVPECSTELDQRSQIDNRNFELLKQKTFLRYQEMFDVSVKGDVLDKVNDVYDRYPIGAIKSVQFNPNHLQCCWVAYGGEAGIVRLNTVYDLVPVQTRQAIRKHCKHLR